MAGHKAGYKIKRVYLERVFDKEFLTIWALACVIALIMIGWWWLTFLAK
jgi:multidrug resistance efflux pump